MTTKLKPVEDIRDMMRFALASVDLLNDCNEVVSQWAHGLRKRGFDSDFDSEDIYEHLWMILAARIQLRAEENGNDSIIADWKKVLSRSSDGSQR